MSIVEPARGGGPLLGDGVRPRRLAVQRISPLVVPLGLALAYLVVLIVRYPQIIAWQNADSDIASSYQLAEAILHGHAGIVQFSTQGSWLGLGWQLMTAGLLDHRLLWELLAPALGLGTVVVLGRTVARVGGPRAGILAAALVTACSPDALMNLISAPWHNTSTLGATLLGAFLVPRGSRRRSAARRIAATVTLGLVCGVFLACDHLLAIIGLIPFVLASAICAPSEGRRRALEAIAVCAVAAVTSAAVAALTAGLGLRTTTPGLWPASGSQMVVHLRWLFQGLLRLGNGLSLGSHPVVVTPLVVASALVTVLGLGAMLVVTARALTARREDPRRAAHAAFWCASAVCAVLAYVVTNAAYEPSDRYLFILVPAVACTAVLLDGSRARVRGAVTGAAGTVIAAGLAALAAGALHTPGAIITTGATSRLRELESLVRRDHLVKGYAGYWNAAALEWSSGERLHIAPLLGTTASAAPMFSMRVAAWYRPRRDTPSYLVLAPDDPTLPDRLPRRLPPPARTVRLGAVTVDSRPFDIAAYLSPSEIPVPGLTGRQLRRARRGDAPLAAR
jgi:hypothetical protein